MRFTSRFWGGLCAVAVMACGACGETTGGGSGGQAAGGAGGTPVADLGPTGGVVVPPDGGPVLDASVPLDARRSGDAITAFDAVAPTDALPAKDAVPPCTTDNDCPENFGCRGAACVEIATDCPEGATRLADGGSLRRGRVEVCHAGQWGTVCAEGFDVLAARVACGQLGLGDAQGAAFGVDLFPAGAGRQWLTALACMGDEPRLTGCPHAPFGPGDCTHADDVGLDCQPSTELCNGHDDNGDGLVDEDNPGGGQPCDTGLPGGCADGTTACQGGLLVCNPRQAPEAERCDGVDNDCDGTVDNGNPESDVPCDTGLLGACATGATTCDAPGVLRCNVTHPPAPELCNGVDDDCDGTVDDGDPEGDMPCETGELGLCAVGLSQCVDGVLACNPRNGARAETCNGVDDDCNGVVDDNPHGVGGVCEADALGVCVDGTLQCLDGIIVCAPSHLPQAERCNGLDDDCDGSVDEELVDIDLPCDTGRPGICAVGNSRCDGGALACDVTVQPAEEICDGLDNDCNGAADDGAYPSVPCDTGLPGVCAAGMMGCSGGAMVCQGEAPAPETCDGLDNDCDGEIDNAPSGDGLGEACDTGAPGPCAPGGWSCVGGAVVCVGAPPQAEICDGIDNDCDGVVDNNTAGEGRRCPGRLPGACGVGALSCQRGALICVTPDPQPEICNGVDDNCDGSVDEGEPGAGAPCNSGLPGLCAQGVSACRNGGLACDSAVAPQPEICNGVDDNCDGSIDEGACGRPIFANGGGYACPTGANVWYPDAPVDPNSSVQAHQACEACYGVGACVLNNADCAGPGWGPGGDGNYACGQAFFGYTAGCSGDSGRVWSICSSYTTYGYWGR